MSTRELFNDRAKQRVHAAVVRVEAQTSAEVVVAVRRKAGHYRDVDFAVGAVSAFATLAVLIYSDREYETLLIPLDVAFAFVLGALVSAFTPWLHGILVTTGRLRASARSAAYEAFAAMRVGRTIGRTGILVLAAVEERQVAVIWDVGIESTQLGPSFEQAIRSLEGSIARRSPKLDDFVAAIEALGPVLSERLPRAADDANELSDDVEAA